MWEALHIAIKATLPALRELGLAAGKLGEDLALGSSVAIQQVLEDARGADGEFLANSLLLRAQKRAIYLPHNDGHFALGARAYCHFTSPIRRYPDITVHRALKAYLDGTLESRERQQIAGALPQLCRTCSDREREADAAARESQKIKMAEFYSHRIGLRAWGTVVGMESFGLFVMLDDTCASGLVPTHKLGEEHFTYDEARMTLAGEESGTLWRVGARVCVEVTQTNIERGQIDFALAPQLATVPRHAPQPSDTPKSKTPTG